jgi:DNA-binding response OmpR family regulator
MPKKILIADDEPNIVTSLQFLMKRKGYEVSIARNGEEALQQIAAVAPDLILLDVMMPLKSGYEVCQKVRETPAYQRMKIIMLSAKGRDVEVAKGLGLGADAYVTKPFATQELIAKVEELLAKDADSGRA